MHSCGSVEIALRVDAHSVRASAGIEVVMNPHIADGAIGKKVVRTDHSGATLRAVRLHEIQRAIIRRNLNAIGPLDVGGVEDASQLSRSIDSVDRSTVEIREVQAPLPINRDVVRPDQRLSFVTFGEYFDFACLEVRPCDARFPAYGQAVPLRGCGGRTFACNEAPLGIDK